MDVNLNLDSLCLSDPKNQLQYQFYKVSLALQSLAAEIIPVLKNSPEVWMASVRYKKLAHLARCSKKKRVRVKNLKRLYKLGQRIEKKAR